MQLTLPSLKQGHKCGKKKQNKTKQNQNKQKLPQMSVKETTNEALEGPKRGCVKIVERLLKKRAVVQAALGCYGRAPDEMSEDSLNPTREMHTQHSSHSC